MTGRCFLLSVAVLCLPGGDVAAHDSQSPLSIALSLGKKVRVRLDYRVVDAAQAEQLRERADRDGDTRLSKKERATLVGYLADRAKKAFVLDIDGTPVSFAVDKVRPAPRAVFSVMVDLVTHVRWRPGRHRLVVHANVRQARAVTRVSVRAHLPVRLLQSPAPSRAMRHVPLVLLVDARGCP